ncbi:hypothetical protein TNCV_407401 [Trichonephila clavipes]|nr:hypothetical protein TNCV_407401 [Trichonephila clavipes]
MQRRSLFGQPRSPVLVTFAKVTSAEFRILSNFGISELVDQRTRSSAYMFLERHCCRISAADKECRVYPLNPRPVAVALYSGCTPGKRRAWFLPDDRQNHEYSY